MSRHTISTEENKSGRNSPGAPGHKSVEYGYTSSFQNNPASLSPLLASLFPPGVAAAGLRMAGDPSLLFPDETRYLGRAVPKRTREFAAGRLCARRALAEFGVTGYPLRMNRDRRPHWPAPVIGSITHTTGMSGAVVASRKHTAPSAWIWRSSGA
jgi:4'-phosphopantetheinyl transferase EntD